MLLYFSPVLKEINYILKSKLEDRVIAGNYRTLSTSTFNTDLSSNDYLGFARSQLLKDKTDDLL
ncbi:MAG: hypothetical protein EOP48_24450, partial [Sphingobacteriales bacterium]